MSEATEQGPSTVEERLVRLAALALSSIAAVTLFAMMVLTFFDVWGRYIFNSPVFGGYEVTEFMMGILIFTALPLLCVQEGHVTIDLLDHILPRWSLRWQRFAVNLISAGVLAVMAWRLYLISGEHARNDEVTMTLKIPFSPFSLAFSIMAACAAVACLVVTWSYLRGSREATAGVS